MWGGGGDEEEGRTARSKEFPITTETDPLLVRSKGLEYCGGLLGNNSTYGKKKREGLSWLSVRDMAFARETSNLRFFPFRKNVEFLLFSGKKRR